MRQKKIIVIVALIILIPIFIYLATYFTAAMKPAFSTENNTSIVQTNNDLLAQVGEYEISQYNVDQYIIMQQSIGKISESHYNTEYDALVDEYKVLKKLIRDKLYYIEAQNRDLLVSRYEVNEYIDLMKESFSNNEISNSIEGQILLEFAHDQGMNIEEYLDSLFAVYEELLTIGRLKADIVSTQDSLSEQTEKWDSFGQNLESKYEQIVEINNWQ